MFFNRLADVIFSRPSRSVPELHSDQAETENLSPQQVTAKAYRGKMMDWFGWNV
jgi:hypothetical protein